MEIGCKWEVYLMKNKIFRKVSYVVIIIIVFVFCIWQNNDLTVSEYVYESEKVGESLEGYRIIQISDLHNKKFGSNQKRLVNLLEKKDADIIVITGDIVDSSETDIPSALEFAKQVVKIAPVYYVTGNHETWLNQKEYIELIQGLQNCGVIVMDNKAMEIKINNDSFYLIGLDDKCLKDSTLADIMCNLKSDSFKILLAHEPQELKHYGASDIDLVFSGHAHGGQFRLPFLGGLVAPDQGFLPEYTAGKYKYNNTTMIVNRGLGNSIIPIRIGNRPEVVVTSLQQK